MKIRDRRCEIGLSNEPPGVAPLEVKYFVKVAVGSPNNKFRLSARGGVNLEA